MNTQQFRKPANGHSRTAIVKGRIVGGRGFRLQSKLGRAISLHRLERLLAQAQQPGRGMTPNPSGELRWMMPSPLREIRITSLQQWSNDYHDEERWGPGLRDMPDAMVDEWIEVTEGRALLITPDGRKWWTPVTGEVSDPHLLSEAAAVLVDALIDHHGRAHTSIGPWMPIMFFDAATLSPTRAFCHDCNRWVDLSEEQRNQITNEEEED